MLLVVMGLLIAAGLYIFAEFGVSKSGKAERVALATSLIALFWSLLQICVSYQNLYIRTPIIEKSKDWGFSVAQNTKEVGLESNNVLWENLSPFSIEAFFYKGDGILDITKSVALGLDYGTFDGLTAVFVGLTAIITPIAILASEKKTEMLSSLLLVEALLLGAFVTYDFITFYALFESVLIPMFFLIGGTGSGATFFRSGAAYRLFLYTLGGSVLMLLALIILYLETGTLNWYLLVLKSVYSGKDSLFIESGIPFLQNCRIDYIAFPLIFIAFAVKVPMIPVHLWLPEAHTIAPTPGSMILAALLLKLGGYGILRWLMPIFPEATVFYSPFVLVLALISTTYACLTCLRQIDVKRIIAYSSIVHMNICIYSIFTLNPLAIKGAIFEMFSHGIISTGMFFLIGVVYNRHDTRILKYFRGLVLQMPIFSTVFFIFIIANSGVPLTCGFIGEFIMLSGSMGALPLLTLILTLMTIVNAGYNIWLFNRMCFGGYSPYLGKTLDLTRREFYVLAPLLVFIVALGIFPNYLFMFIDGIF